jgi:hypothetical protein
METLNSHIEQLVQEERGERKGQSGTQQDAGHGGILAKLGNHVNGIHNEGHESGAELDIGERNRQRLEQVREGIDDVIGGCGSILAVVLVSSGVLLIVVEF